MRFNRTMQDFFEIAFGSTAQDLTWWQMSLRAVVIFFLALLIIRIGNKRIFGKNSAFDIVLGVIYGSVLSRAITGNAPFWPTVGAAFTLVLLHKSLAALAYKHHSFGNLIKGNTSLLIKDGKVQQDNVRQNSITENDLLEALRGSGQEADVTSIKTAILERSGSISVIPKKEK